jgi:beta-1,4-N-acetylglucosaminyltransferase
MKLLLVCNPGGHFSTMMGLKELWSKHQREWVTYSRADTEKLRGEEEVHWVIKQEARKTGSTLVNFWKALWILHKSRPDLVISTGSSLAVPFIFASKLFGIKTIFVESISRSYDLSLAGKLVYKIVDEIYVQWPECSQSYPKAQYRGMVL